MWLFTVNGPSTSGSRVCCSSFCFRDVQGLNGFTSRVCMSRPIPPISRHLLLPNEGNVISNFVPTGRITLSRRVTRIKMCTLNPPRLAPTPLCSPPPPPGSPSRRARAACFPAAASLTNLAPCFSLPRRSAPRHRAERTVDSFKDFEKSQEDTCGGGVYLAARCDGLVSGGGPPNFSLSAGPSLRLVAFT